MPFVLSSTLMNHDNLLKTGGRSITQLAKMSINHELVELTADVVRIILSSNIRKGGRGVIPNEDIIN